jgi:hypothetical protein
MDGGMILKWGDRVVEGILGGDFITGVDIYRGGLGELGRGEGGIGAPTWS